MTLEWSTTTWNLQFTAGVESRGVHVVVVAAARVVGWNYDAGDVDRRWDLHVFMVTPRRLKKRVTGFKNSNAARTAASTYVEDWIKRFGT